MKRATEKALACLLRFSDFSFLLCHSRHLHTGASIVETDGIENEQ